MITTASNTLNVGMVDNDINREKETNHLSIQDSEPQAEDWDYEVEYVNPEALTTTPQIMTGGDLSLIHI